MPERGKTRPGHEAHIAHADHCDAHNALLRRLRKKNLENAFMIRDSCVHNRRFNEE
jgi:hypothetical protein